jgi:hypothetical protein
VSLINRASPTPPGPHPTATGLEGAVDRAVAYLGPYLESLVARSAPTPAVLRALADELGRARSGARAVAHPELVDSDVYWEKSAWPQAASVVKHARRALVEVADELEPPVRASEQVIEQWLTALVHESSAERAAGPDAARHATIDAIATRCGEVHRVVERLLAVRPTPAPLASARAELDKARAKHASDDGIPLRHQELLVRAFELALEAIARDVQAMVGELTEPILGIGERLVRRYDEIASEADAFHVDALRVEDRWAGSEPLDR